MNRSVNGLEGAGEWYELKRLMPDFNGKRVLDLGCGYGWHCIYAAENGANFVLGTDISKRMLDVAKSKTSFRQIWYEQTAMEDLTCEPSSFDVVISSLAFHYLRDYEIMVKKIYDWLVRGVTLYSQLNTLYLLHWEIRIGIMLLMVP